MSKPWQSRVTTTCAVDNAIAFPQLPHSTGSDLDEAATPLCERVLSNLSRSSSGRYGAEVPLRMSTTLTPHDNVEQHLLRERRGRTKSGLRIRTIQPQVGMPHEMIDSPGTIESGTNTAVPLRSRASSQCEQPNDCPFSALSVTESSWSVVLSHAPCSPSAMPAVPDSARSGSSMDGEAAWKLRSALRDDARHLFEAKWSEAESLNSFVHSALTMLSEQAEGGFKTLGLDNKTTKHSSLPSPRRMTPLTPRAGTVHL